MKNVTLVAMPLLLVTIVLLASSCAPKPPPFVPPPALAGSTVQKPRITIRNDYHQEMVFGVDGTERRVVTVPPKSSLVIRLKEGVYRYAAAAKGARPVTGFKQFHHNHRYELKFGIGQGRAD